MSICFCCEKDSEGDFITPPCCDHSGICVAYTTGKEDDGSISSCTCCGAEMFKDGGLWWHHEQKEIPLNERGTIHYQTENIVPA